MEFDISDRILRRHEVTLLMAMYWDYDAIDNMVEIARLESSWHTGAHNLTDLEDSRGLLQINVRAHPGYAAYNLYDPQLNAYWAWVLYQTQGYHAWANSARKLGLI